jgi:L-threonylcarbamoyladenylate synthase
MNPDVAAVARVVSEGGVALLPTDTIYGLHALATNDAAIAKLAGMKGRDDGKPFIVLAASIEQAETIGARFPPQTREILRQYWPGPLTAIVLLNEAIAASRGASTIAVRVPELAWLRDLVARTGPLASTSANRSGEPPIHDPKLLSHDLQERIDVVIDGGSLEGKPSTIVDFTGDEPRFIREGESLFTQKVWKTLRKSL